MEGAAPRECARDYLSSTCYSFTSPVNLNTATKTFAILAKRGVGQTYTAAVHAEEFHKNHPQGAACAIVYGPSPVHSAPAYATLCFY